jgi:hypothetical protein
MPPIRHGESDSDEAATNAGSPGPSFTNDDKDDLLAIGSDRGAASRQIVRVRIRA